jgi:hypothetical protein
MGVDMGCGMGASCLPYTILDCTLSLFWSVLFAYRLVRNAALESNLGSFGSSQRPASTSTSIYSSRPLDTGNDRSGSPSSIVLLAKVRALDTRRLAV